MNSSVGLLLGVMGPVGSTDCAIGAAEREGETPFAERSGLPISVPDLLVARRSDARRPNSRDWQSRYHAAY